MIQVLVLGLGVSGLGSVAFLLKKGYSVLGCDAKIEEKKGDPYVQSLCQEGLILITDSSSLDWTSIQLLIISPGISLEHPLCQLAKSQGIVVIGEMELGLCHLNQPAVAITGTNGKTTVTALVTHILNSAHIKAKAVGNIGQALTTYLLHPDLNEILVVELSSYQLETSTSKVFDAGIILNITPDHLDRYRTMEQYARAKLQLQYCLKPEGALYIQTQLVKEYGHWIHTPYQTFGSVEGSTWLTNKEVAKKLEIVEYFLPVKYKNKGIHESENALAAWLLCRQLGVTSEQFFHGLETFQSLPHRIEFVMEFEGLMFYDDSKGTNLDAVIQAVNAMQGPVILIVGGVDKGASYLPWKECFQGKVKKILAMGSAAPKIHGELSPYFDVEPVYSLSSAVEKSVLYGKRGDSVLLSPGCSSFDMFRDYVERGDQFQKCVRVEKEKK